MINLNEYTGKIIVERGKKIVDKITIHDIFLSQRYENAIVISGSARGNGGNYDTSMLVEIDEDGYEEIIGGNCTCPYDGFCKHLVALTFKTLQNIAYYDIKHEILENYGSLSSHTPQKLVDNFSTSFVDEMKTEILNDLVNEVAPPKYTLEPIINFNGENTLSLKIGEIGKKSYVVKNIYEFAYMMDNNIQFTYGKNLEVEHNINYFEHSELVKYLLELTRKSKSIINTLEEKNNSYHSYYYSSTFKYDKKNLVLTDDELMYVLKLFYKYNPAGSVIVDNTKVAVNIVQKNTYLEASLVEAYKIATYSSDAMLYDKDKKLVIREFKNKTALTFFIGVLGQKVQFKKEDLYNFKKIIAKELEDDFDFIYEYDEIEEIEVEDLVVKVQMEDGSAIIDLDVDINKMYDQRNLILLENLLDEYKLGNQYKIEDLDMIFEFIQHKLTLIYDFADQVLVTEEFKNIKLVDNYSISAKAKVNKSSLELDLLTTNFNADELVDVLQAYHKKQKYYQLNNGDFITLDNEELGKMTDLMSGLNITLDDIKNNKVSLDKYRALYLDQKMEELNLKLEKNTNYKKMLNDIKMLSDHEFNVPKVINADLREYQKDGFNWLKHLEHYNFGGILADDMGLGKTLQVITLLSTNEFKTPSLVICPSSLAMNWAYEIEKFAPHIKYLLLNQGKKEREDKIKELNDYDVIITTYDVLKRDILLLEEVEFEYVILDEAQYIKNHTTQAAKATKLLKANKRLVLTGTPIENSIAELWSIFDFLMPNYLLNYSAFSKKYEKPIIKEGNLKMLNELRELVAPFILRRLKQDVLTELPDKTVTTIYAEMDKKQRKLYDASVMELKNLITNKTGDELNTSKLEVLSLLTRLRQICCNPHLVYDNYKGDSAKYDVVLELVEELKSSGHKIIIFSQFTSNFSYLKDLFDKQKTTYFELTGQTNKNKRHQMVEEFNHNDTNVFLISLKAGGTGLNITGADTVIHLDPWWNVAAENQATDRVHRMGQKKHVNVYKIIAKDTIEEKILNMQQDKLDIANSVLEDNDISLKTMTKDDMLDILSKPLK